MCVDYIFVLCTAKLVLLDHVIDALLLVFLHTAAAEAEFHLQMECLGRVTSVVETPLPVY